MKNNMNRAGYDERLKSLLTQFTHPLTARQLAEKTALPLATCSRHLRTVGKIGLATCANPKARRSRVYTLTRKGEQLQQQLRAKEGLPPTTAPEQINLELYGWLCYRHRTAILKAMNEPLQPAAIKRRARRSDPSIKMSANNVRDVIYLFVKKGIAQPIAIRGKAHLRYELTNQGRTIKKLLEQTH